MRSIRTCRLPRISGLEWRCVELPGRIGRRLSRRSQKLCRSSICWRAARASFPAASGSAPRWGARLSRCPAASRSTTRDAKLRVDMRVEIKRLHQATGSTIVYVTHDQIEAMTLATKIAVLKNGELQQVGSPSEIYNRPANMFVADFMGSPAMNLLEGTVVQVDGQQRIALARKDGSLIMLPVPAS